SLALLSPYLGKFAFPRREAHYDRYLTFRTASPAERERWKEALLLFLKKLTLKYRRRLLLKSPTHTARIGLLLEVFPDARFVHIRRSPYAVYQSTRHLFDTYAWHTYFQVPDLNGLEERILRRYSDMYDAFFADRERIAPGRLHELSFEELERDPLGQVGLLYEKLGLAGFARVEPKLRQYVTSVAGYRKNDFRELPPDLCGRVAAAWGRSFEAWG